MSVSARAPGFVRFVEGCDSLLPGFSCHALKLACRMSCRAATFADRPKRWLGEGCDGEWGQRVRAWKDGRKDGWVVNACEVERDSF